MPLVCAVVGRSVSQIIGTKELFTRYEWLMTASHRAAAAAAAAALVGQLLLHNECT